MDRTKPLFIKDVDMLRRRVAAIEAGGDTPRQDAKLWNLVKNCARTAPDRYPWFTPFVALMTQNEQDIENAKQVIRSYINKLEPMYFTSGLQYHFWCFAFPHAKWSAYFQWLVTIGAFSKDEEDHIRETLISYQFLNFYFGMRTKPEPECIDNQTLSLCFSNVLVGYLFSNGDDPSLMAKTMLEEGLRRLPSIIGGMPPSGYTGEGSTYMDCVVGPAIPLAVELMEEITGEHDLYYRPFEPNGVVPEQVLNMIAREWMPGGLLLPWDNYGYQHGVRAPIAYAAMKTNQELFKNILHRHAVWSYDIGVGWAYDDLVWTFVWWPEGDAPGQDSGFRWSHPDVGGAITAQGNDFYLMQMWDESAPVIPTRSHVNPNAVVLNAYEVPLTLDGSAGNCSRFHFEDTWREVQHSIGEKLRYNYGDGCGGAHSVMLVDGWEGMRAMSEYKQYQALELNPLQGVISADVTPIYRERFPDAVRVRRRSSAACDRFFIIEDDARFHQPHTFTSRFVLRPGIVNTAVGAKIQTSEGITLHLLELSGNTTVSSETIGDYIQMYTMDRETVLIDFIGNSGSRIFIAFASRAFAPAALEENWKAIYETGQALSPEQARDQLAESAIVLPFQLPAHMEQPLPIAKTWWYGKTVRKREGKGWLQLPRGMKKAQTWINGEAVDLTECKSNSIAPVVPIPPALEDETEIEVIVRTDVPVSHYDYEDESGSVIGFNGGVHLCYPCQEETISKASYDGRCIEVVTNLQTYRTAYRRMEE